MATIYTPKKYKDNFHKHIDRIASGEVLAGSISTGIKKIDDVLIPIGPTDLGVILANQGHGKCLAKGTKVVMYDGNLCNVEDIVPGDKLMGPDSKPRNVLSIARGREQMYWIRQSRAMDYRVNESHILSLTTTKMARMGRYVNKNVADLYNDYQYQFSASKPLKGYRAILNFAPRFDKSYMFAFGVLMGHPYADGTLILSKNITKQEVIGFVSLFKYFRSIKLSNGNYAIDKFGDNYCVSDLLSLLSTSREEIMSYVRIASVHEKINFLRGLYAVWSPFSAEELNNLTLIDDSMPETLRFIVNSLGFIYHEYDKYENYMRIYCAIEWNKIGRRKRGWINHDLSDIRIEKDIIDDYYGFVIDGDHLFLLEDFTVTHNTSFMMHMMFNACHMYNQNRNAYSPPIYITKETAIEEILLRLLSNYATIDIGDIKRSKSYVNWQDMHQYADKMMDEYPIIFIGHSMYMADSRKSLSAQRVIEDVDKVHQNYGVPSILIDIDYLQRFDWDGESDRRMSLFKCVDGFKDMALESNSTILLGCQAKREVADRTFPVPMERDALETSNIEHTADWMISLLRPSKYWEVGSVIPKSKNNTIVTPDLFYMHILKQRSGDVNIGSYCSFDPRVFAFADIEE